jgi:glycosyltransferase involved in cell wall biosynthesis
MKKIIIVNNNMNIGGVQKSLYNLLWEIHDQYDVTLLLFRKNGVYAQQLPTNVTVLECNGLFRFLGMSQSQCSGIEKLKRGVLALIAKFFGRPIAMKLVLASQRMLPNRYDCAIAFLHNGNIKNFYGGVQEFVLHKINAPKKVAFLHCDYGRCGANHPANNALISQFDSIAACSDGCRKAFEMVLPEAKDRSCTVRNCHRIEEIHTLANANPLQYDAETVNVVMVSRLAHEKGIERAIEAVSYTVHQGYKVRLHLVGGGPMEDVLRETAVAHGIAQNVVFYGEQSNPYRYMKNADLFLLTSFHEAAPIVIEEARCLGLPVLTVQTTSSEEMVLQPNCGWVCENNQQALNETLLSRVIDRMGLRQMHQQICDRGIDNVRAKKQFVALIDE